MEEQRPNHPCGSPAVSGSFRRLGGLASGVAEEARTRGFATPAFADGW